MSKPYLLFRDRRLNIFIPLFHLIIHYFYLCYCLFTNRLLFNFLPPKPQSSLVHFPENPFPLYIFSALYLLTLFSISFMLLFHSLSNLWVNSLGFRWFLVHL